MVTAAAKAVFKVDLYASSKTFLGGINGLKTNGDIWLFPGVNTCKSGILSTKARYSFLAGSITRNGILYSFHRRSRRLMEKVVLPEPGVPTMSICFVRSFRKKPMVLLRVELFRKPTVMFPPLIIPLE